MERNPRRKVRKKTWENVVGRIGGIGGYCTSFSRKRPIIQRGIGHPMAIHTNYNYKSHFPGFNWTVHFLHWKKCRNFLTAIVICTW
jgi:hypothetical protein